MTASARMPVPPLLADLAGWGWRLLLLSVIGWLSLRVAQKLYLVSLPIAASLLVTALLLPAVSGLRRLGQPRALATAITVLGMLAVVVGLLVWVVQRAIAEAPTLSSELSSAVQRLPLSNATLQRMRGQFVDYLQSGSGSLAGGVITGLQTGAEVLTGVLLTLLSRSSCWRTARGCGNGWSPGCRRARAPGWSGPGCRRGSGCPAGCAAPS